MEQTLGDFLREARGDRSPTEIVRAGGPLPQNLYAIEKGKIPGVKTLKWLCEHYGVSFDTALDLLQQSRRVRDLAAVAV